jgi:hypothetical protein
MGHLARLFVSLPWWELTPDLGNQFLVHGHQTGRHRAVAAVSRDSQFAIIYAPTVRPLYVALERLAGPHVCAQWYDVSNGQLYETLGAPFPATAIHQFRADRNNGADYEDWVLIFESTGAA